MNEIESKNPCPLKVGDTFTMAGSYQRRSWWQWLTRQPQRLVVYQVRGAVGHDPSPSAPSPPRCERPGGG